MIARPSSQATVQEWGKSALADILKLARTQMFGHLQGVEWTFNSTFSMLRRRWLVLASCLGGALALCVLLLIITPRQFTAETMLQINTRTEQVTNMEDVVSGLSSSDAAIRTELDVLTSRKVALRVIRNEKLLQNPDFGGSFGVVSLLKNLISAALLPMQREAEPATQTDPKYLVESPEETKAINGLLTNLNVSMKPRSFSIVVRYTAGTPELAQSVVNAVAQEYLNNQLEERFDATKRANDWINARLKQLQSNVQRSELAVRKFREANGLTEALGVTLNDQQLSELNSQLILARTQLAEAEAKVVSTRRGVGTTSEVINNPLIQSLRIQETEVRRKMSDLASRYGPMHPRMQTVRNELANVQSKIGEEMGKIRGSLDNDIDMSRARVKTLEDQLQQLQQRGQMASGPAVQLAELERQATAERSLYESFLERSRQIAQMDFVQADARVISAAELPSDPSSPKPLLWLLVALLLGGGLGVALMLLLELLDSGFRTTSQIESHLQAAPLGLLGELPVGEDVAHFVVKKPTSAFSEGVRAVRTALQFANPDKPVQVVMVTSSVPQEGKSIFAASLAQLTAHGGSRVLLIDADMRRPSMAKKMGFEAKAGLAELLIGQSKPKDVLLTDKASGLHVIPALANTQFAQELLGSEKMATLLATWRKEYDLIVLDCPPVMAVADAVTLSKLCDAVVFVVRWGTTPRVLAAHAMKQLRNAHTNVAGVVLTRVDLEKQQAYGYGDYGYYYGKYKEYYTE
jgi:succinoglycan biosynthesis transport protein ExoP